MLLWEFLLFFLPSLWSVLFLEAVGHQVQAIVQEKNGLSLQNKNKITHVGLITLNKQQRSIKNRISYHYSKFR